MLSRDLLIDSVAAVHAAGFGSGSLIQRKVRVGCVTGRGLLSALQDAGVLARVGNAGRYPVLAAARSDEDAAVQLVDDAIAAGRIAVNSTSQHTATTCSSCGDDIWKRESVFVVERGAVLCLVCGVRDRGLPG